MEEQAGTGAGLSQWPGSDHMIEELNLSLLLGTEDLFDPSLKRTLWVILTSFTLLSQAHAG